MFGWVYSRVKGILPIVLNCGVMQRNWLWFNKYSPSTDTLSNVHVTEMSEASCMSCTHGPDTTTGVPPRTLPTLGNTFTSCTSAIRHHYVVTKCTNNYDDADTHIFMQLEIPCRNVTSSFINFKLD